MKKYFLAGCTLLSFVLGCKKNNLNEAKYWDYNDPANAQIKFINAYTALTPSAATPANGPSVDIYVNNIKVNATPVAYGSVYPAVSGTYAAVPNGLVNIKVIVNRTGGNIAGDTLANGSYRLAVGGKSSIILVDPQPNPTPLSPNLMVIGETASVPSTYGVFRARFINLYAAPDTLEIFSTYYNRVVCSGQVYKNLSEWIELPVPIPSPATADVWQLRKPGTTTALNTITFAPGVSRSYTFWTRGNPSVTGRTRTYSNFLTQ
jgi:hypothetical protein